MWPDDLERLEEARDVVESSFENGEPRPSLETLEEVARALLVRFREKYDQRIFDAFYRFTYRLFASYTDRTIKKLRARVERDAVVEALARAGNNRSLAARLLGVSRRTLYKKLDEYKVA